MEKLRVIMTTDSEIDDKCSMLRFLLYTNEFDVEGLISVNSKWQKDGHGEIWIHDMIDKYAECYENLLLHDENYPHPNFLHSKVVQGLVDRAPLYAEAPPYYDCSPSTQYIIDKLLDDDERPIYISMWGSGVLVANVFWTIKNKYSEAEYQKAVKKARLYFIDYQEFGNGGGKWLRENLPEVMNILDYQFADTLNYRPRKAMPYEELMGEEWLNENVRTNHGPLGEMYYIMDNGLYVSEGDSPSYLWLVQNGLRSHENPEFGGWGGRHKNIGDNQYADACDDGDYKKPIWRWATAFQNDFAMRMDWCVKKFDEAVHTPVVILDSELDRDVKAGDKITISASKSYSRNDNELSFEWWRYYDADSCDIDFAISCNDSEVSFIVPNDALKTIHLICEVTDMGTPNVKKYARVIFTIK